MNPAFEQFCTRLALTLGHFLWQGAVLGLVAWLAASLLRGRYERFRYPVLLTCFLAMPAAAVVTSMLVDVPNPVLPSSPTATLESELPKLLEAPTPTTKEVATSAEALAVSKSQFQHYIDYDGGRYSRSVGGTLHEIPTEGHVTLAFIMSPLWQRSPHKEPMPIVPG